MDSNKRFIVLLIIIIITIVCLAGYYFIGMNDNVSLNDIVPGISRITNKINNHTNRNATQNTASNNNANQNISNGTGQDGKAEFSTVRDYQIYFNINALINKYYTNVVANNQKEIIGLLDDTYVSINNISGNNISNFVKTGYQNITYYSKTMYVKSRNNISYYFVSGEEQLYDFIDEQLIEEENVLYLVIIDNKTDSYSITPLITPSLFEYAQNFTISSKKTVKSNAYNSYFSDRFSDETICSYYVNYYKTLLFLNSEKAYNMLEQSYKSSFNDYEDFVNHLTEIYERLTPKLHSYSVNGENGRRTYSVIGENETRVDMTETSILNFKIAIK